MNRNVIIAVAALIIVGIGGFVVSKQNKPTNTQNPTGKMENNSPQQGNGQQSLKELFASGASQTCTFKNPDSKESMGTVYVAGGKVRGDFTVAVSGKNVTTHMIGDGTTSYIWTDGQGMGFKMAFDPTTETEQPNKEQSQGMDVNAKMNYNCSAWSVDQTQFVIPTNIKFSEMNVPKMGTSVKGQENMDMKIQQCAACDNIPPSGRDECKKALGCS